MPMVGVAVVGCGRIGRVHARNAAGNSRASLVMVFDVAGTAAEETATELGVKAARSLEEVLSDRSVEAVLLATPTDTHVPLITAAVKAGKAVLCEKPVDLDPQRARECWSGIAGGNPRVMVGFNRRFDPSFKSLRERLQGGEVGRPDARHDHSRFRHGALPGGRYRAGARVRRESRRSLDGCAR